MEVKDLFDYLGVEAKDLDSFKSAFATKFVTKDEAWQDDEIKSKVTGRVTNEVQRFIKNEFGLTNEEIKGLHYEEVLKLGAEKYKNKINELETKFNLEGDEKVKSLSEELNKYKNSISDYKTQLDTTKKALEETQNEWQGKYKGLQISQVLNEAKSKVAPRLKSDMTEAERFYLDHKIKESVKLDFDESGSVVVLDTEGKRISNPNKVGEFMGLEEVIGSIAEKENLIKKNNAGNSNVPLNVVTNQDNKAEIVNKQGRRLHPNALR
jgi:hypothetical protein